MTPAQAKREALRELRPRLGRDWFYAAPAFAAAFEFLRNDPAALKAGTVIWHAGENDVIRLRLPEQFGDFDVVYKQTEGMPKWRHAVRASTALKEAANYLMLAKLGFPCAEMLAVGEGRTWRYWHSAFLVTRFAEGYQDGRHILPGFDHGDDIAMRDKVIRACLSCLAKLHQHRLYHKAFKLYNILWRDEGETAGLKLIDVSSCKLVRFRPFLPYRIKDLADFFKPFDFSDRELTSWLDHYNAEGQEKTEQLLQLLRPAFTKAGFNWKQAQRNR